MISIHDKFNSIPKAPEDLNMNPNLKIHRLDGNPDVDPITYEVIRHRLMRINDEQRITISKVSGSHVATEANDFNVVIGDEFGEIVVIGSGIVYHCQSEMIIKWILENRSFNPGIREGDMFLTSDPWVGAIHHQDVSVVAPLFIDGELFSWTASTIHQIDLGGTNAGSFCFDAKDVFSEGVMIPAIKIVEGGEIRKDLEDMYLRSSRTPHMLALDLRAFVAGHHVAHERIRHLVKQYGKDTIKAVMADMMNHAEQLFRKRLLELPDGTWRNEGYHEVSRTGDRGVYKIQLTIEKKGEEITFDYTGTDPQAGIINCTYAGLSGATYATVLATLCSDIPWTIGGIKRPIKFITEEGTLNNCKHPAGVSAGAIAGTCHTINVLCGAISKMLAASPKYKQQLITSSLGAWATMYFSGTDKNGNPIVNIIMDAMAAGLGARAWKDGDNTGGIIHAPIGQVSNVETNELDYPFLYLYRKEEIDSGGAGKYRGGAGGSLAVVLHETPDPLTWEWFSYGMAFPTSPGICGGYPTKTTEAKLIRNTDVFDIFKRNEIPEGIDELQGEVEEFLPKGSYTQYKNDVFRCYWQGGGGYGDPIDRDIEKVRKDVINDYVSLETAEKIYGVILDPSSKQVLEKETEERRAMIRKERLSAIINSGVYGRDEHVKSNA
jgi:N-methylhydantoinase B